jgi:membrane associated rhomboid family serine protease
MTLSFPPFTRAIKILIGLNAGIYFLQVFLRAVHVAAPANWIDHTFCLVARDVVGGHIYQLITYGFLHGSIWHLLFNMLALWMFGSMLESAWGGRKFWEFYLFGVVGAGITTVVIAYTFGSVLHLSPDVPTLGASGGIYAIFMATAMLFGNREAFLFPLPFAIKLKYLVAIMGFIALVSALSGPGETANVAHLGGLLFGYIFVRFVPRRGLLLSFSEGYYGIRNAYHRGKRKRAAKKFQVYMRKHEDDPKRFFPEDPDKDKKDGPWVN